MCIYVVVYYFFQDASTLLPGVAFTRIADRPRRTAVDYTTVADERRGVSGGAESIFRLRRRRSRGRQRSKRGRVRPAGVRSGVRYGTYSGGRNLRPTIPQLNRSSRRGGKTIENPNKLAKHPPQTLFIYYTKYVSFRFKLCCSFTKKLCRFKLYSFTKLCRSQLTQIVFIFIPYPMRLLLFYIYCCRSFDYFQLQFFCILLIITDKNLNKSLKNKPNTSKIFPCILFSSNKIYFSNKISTVKPNDNKRPYS